MGLGAIDHIRLKRFQYLSKVRPDKRKVRRVDVDCMQSFGATQRKDRCGGWPGIREGRCAMNETQLAGDLFNSVVRSEHSLLTSRKIEKVSYPKESTWLDNGRFMNEKKVISTSFGYILDLRKYAARSSRIRSSQLHFPQGAPSPITLHQKGRATLNDPEVTSSSTREMAIRTGRKLASGATSLHNCSCVTSRNATTHPAAQREIFEAV